MILEHFQDNKLDKCPVACESVEFSAQLSYARYPANTYADYILAKKRNLKGTDEENRRYLRYGLNYELISTPDYTHFVFNKSLNLRFMS